jgi:hypothetical protein
MNAESRVWYETPKHSRMIYRNVFGQPVSSDSSQCLYNPQNE